MISKTTPPAMRIATIVVNTVTAMVRSTCSADIRPKYSEHKRHTTHETFRHFRCFAMSDDVRHSSGRRCCASRISRSAQFQGPDWLGERQYGRGYLAKR